MERISIFDTTLRDGEQSPGASMSIEQKLEIAGQLARLGVDVIEAGFPISSPHQLEGVKLISREVRDRSSRPSRAPWKRTSTAPPRPFEKPSTRVSIPFSPRRPFTWSSSYASRPTRCWTWPSRPCGMPETRSPRSSSHPKTARGAKSRSCVGF